MAEQRLEFVISALDQSRAAIDSARRNLQQLGQESGRSNRQIQGDAKRSAAAIREMTARTKESRDAMVSLRGSLQGLAWGAFAKGALDASLRLDSLKQSLTAVTGSASEAEKQLKGLRALARDRGFNFQVLAQGNLQLQAAGFSARDAERAVRAFANAVRLSGGSADDLKAVLLNLSQIKGMGKLTGDELRESLGRVPILAQVLRKELGSVSSEAIRKLGLSGEEVIERFIAGTERLEQANGGARLSFDQLGDAAKTAMEEIGNAILPVAEAINNTLIPVLRTATDLFKKLPEPAQQALVLGAVGGAMAPRAISAVRGLRGVAPVATTTALETGATVGTGEALGTALGVGGSTVAAEALRRRLAARFGTAAITSANEAAQMGASQTTRTFLAEAALAGGDDAVKAGAQNTAKRGLMSRVGSGVRTGLRVGGRFLGPAAVVATAAEASNELGNFTDRGKQRVGFFEALGAIPQTLPFGLSAPFDRMAEGKIDRNAAQAAAEMRAKFAKEGTPRQRILAEQESARRMAELQRRAMDGADEGRLEAALEQAQALSGGSAIEEAKRSIPVLQQIKTRLKAEADKLRPLVGKDAESTREYWERIKATWRTEGEIRSLDLAARKEVEKLRKDADQKAKKAVQDLERRRKQALDDAKAGRAARAEVVEARIENLPQSMQAQARVQQVIPLLLRQREEALAELQKLKPGTEEFHKKELEIAKKEGEIGQIRNNALRAREQAHKKAEQAQKEAQERAQKAAVGELKTLDAVTDIVQTRIETLEAIDPEAARRMKRGVLTSALLNKFEKLQAPIPGETQEEALRRQLEGEKVKKDVLEAQGFTKDKMRFGRLLGGGSVPLFDQRAALGALDHLNAIQQRPRPIDTSAAAASALADSRIGGAVPNVTFQALFQGTMQQPVDMRAFGDPEFRRRLHAEFDAWMDHMAKANLGGLPGI